MKLSTSFFIVICVIAMRSTYAVNLWDERDGEALLYATFKTMGFQNDERIAEQYEDLKKGRGNAWCEQNKNMLSSPSQTLRYIMELGWDQRNDLAEKLAECVFCDKKNKAMFEEHKYRGAWKENYNTLELYESLAEELRSSLLEPECAKQRKESLELNYYQDYSNSSDQTLKKCHAAGYIHGSLEVAWKYAISLEFKNKTDKEKIQIYKKTEKTTGSLENVITDLARYYEKPVEQMTVIERIKTLRHIAELQQWHKECTEFYKAL